MTISAPGQRLGDLGDVPMKRLIDDVRARGVEDFRVFTDVHEELMARGIVKSACSTSTAGRSNCSRARHRRRRSRPRHPCRTDRVPQPALSRLRAEHLDRHRHQPARRPTRADGQTHRHEDASRQAPVLPAGRPRPARSGRGVTGWERPDSTASQKTRFGPVDNGGCQRERIVAAQL